VGIKPGQIRLNSLGVVGPLEGNRGHRAGIGSAFTSLPALQVSRARLRGIRATALVCREN
jgi:hypothetical protein